MKIEVSNSAPKHLVGWRQVMSIFSWLVMVFPIGMAQQIPVSDNSIFNPRWMNPASVGTSPLNKLMISHQQRRMNYPGVSSYSQFLNFSSGPLGKKGTFGYGATLNHDLEFTERRISGNFLVAAQLINNSNSNLSVGMNVGLINWGSTYNERRVYDPSDPLISSSSNFADLDMGMGMRYLFSNYLVKTEANLAFSQLPGNLVSKSNSPVQLYPHMLAGGNFLLSPDNNFFVGPMLFYRNTVFIKETGLQKAQLDAGLKASIENWGIWAAGAYRINSGAMTGAFGVKLLNPDTLFDQSKMAIFLDLNASASYPLNQSSVFGPSFEIGLIMSFGRVGESQTVVTDSLIRGAFWKNDGNVNTHRVQRLLKGAPPELTALTEVDPKNVKLTYEWDDNIYRYLGDHPLTADDTLLEAVGPEWEGVDAVMPKMVLDVIREALHPDTSLVANPDSVEPLKALIKIELNGKLKATELEADFGAQGAVFMADLPEKYKTDSLSMWIEIDDSIRLITVRKGDNLSNLQLACLKLHAMRKRLEFEMNKYMSGEIFLTWEGSTKKNDDARTVVFLQRPKLRTNHPNQKPFMVTQIQLVFTRFPNYFENKALAEELRSKDEEYRKLSREKKKAKNAYRDIVE